MNSLTLLRSRDGGVTFSAVPTPHADNHGIWFNPDNPSYAIQCERRRRERDHRRRPHLVEHPQPADRRALHGRRGPAASLSALRAAAGQLHRHRPQRSDRLVRLRSSGAGFDAGVGLRDRRDLADARRPRRLGRVQGRGRAPQRPDRSGAGPLDLSAGSLRPSSRRDQVPVPAPDRDHGLAARSEDRLPGLTRPAPFDRRRRDVAGDQPGPHRAREGEPGRAGRPDHARRHRRRGLFDASTRWPSRRSSAA